jgi:hypothetical protein
MLIKSSTNATRKRLIIEFKNIEMKFENVFRSIIVELHTSYVRNVISIIDWRKSCEASFHLIDTIHAHSDDELVIQAI